MNIASIASSAVAANQAQTAQAVETALIKQQVAAEQAIGRMLEHALTDTASSDTALDITV